MQNISLFEFSPAFVFTEPINLHKYFIKFLTKIVRIFLNSWLDLSAGVRNLRPIIYVFNLAIGVKSNRSKNLLHMR